MSFATVRAGGLEFFRAAELQVPNAFTTRRGGVSEGCLSELNLGFHRGDRPRNVLENHRRLAAAVGYDVKRLVCTRQVHGDAVRVVTEADWGQGLFWPAPDCDGLVTQTPGTALAVFVADCTPVLLWDAATGAVGAGRPWASRPAPWRPWPGPSAPGRRTCARPSARASTAAATRRGRTCRRPWRPLWARRPGAPWTTWAAAAGGWI